MTDIKELLKRINEDPTSVKDIDWEQETDVFKIKRLEDIILGIKQEKICIALSKLISCLWYKAVSDVRWEEYSQSGEWLLDIPDKEIYYEWKKNEFGDYYFKPLFNDTRKEDDCPWRGIYIEDVLEDFIQKRNKGRKLDEELNDIMKQFDACCLVSDLKIHEKDTEENSKTFDNTTEEICYGADDAVRNSIVEEQSNDFSNEIKTNKHSDSVAKCFLYPNDYVRGNVEAIVKQFYLNQPVNLALIEVVLFDHGQLCKRNSHTKFVQALIDWGILPDVICRKKTVDGVASKYRNLPTVGYKQWDNNHLNDRTFCANIGKELPDSMKYNR